MRWHFFVLGIITYCLVALVLTIVCAMPFSFEMKKFGIAGVLSLPLFWLSVSKSEAAIKFCRGKPKLFIALVAIISTSSLGFAYAISGTDEECYGVQRKLEALQNNKSVEENNLRDTDAGHANEINNLK